MLGKQNTFIQTNTTHVFISFTSLILACEGKR